VDTLEELLTRISSNFDVYCVDEVGNPYCVPDPREEAVEAESDLGFPTQSEELTPYTVDSYCVYPVTDGGLPNDTVDTAVYAKPGPYVIGYSNGGVGGAADDWIAAWAAHEASLQDDIERLQVLNADGEPEQQLADIAELVAAEVDLLMISPIEQSDMSGLQEAAQAAMDAGIPVVMVGHRTPAPTYVTYVGQDNYEVGCIMSQEIINFVGGEGDVARLHGVDGAPSDVRFKNGEAVVFAEYPGMNAAAEGPTNYSRFTAATYTNSVEVAGILAYTGEIALGGQDGQQRQGLPYVPVVGDHSLELARFLVEEDVRGVMVKTSTQMGAEAVQVALQILNGEPVSQFQRIAPSLIPSSDLAEFDVMAGPEDGYLGDWETLPQQFWPEP
jgi:ribose transport system substrate-binding protein